MAERVVAICQSNYIPWKGYFDLIRRADEFVLLDDVQYTRRDWRNRNLIKTANGPLWLTIPVEVKGRFDQRICDVTIADGGWTQKHFESFQHHYARAPHFRILRDWLGELYAACRDERYLSRVNAHFLRALCDYLQIRTRITWSSDYSPPPERSARLLAICRELRATVYLSGPAAQAYLDVAAFAQHGIRVAWMDYSQYPEYPQLHPPFQHGVSVLDLILMMGPNAARYLFPCAARELTPTSPAATGEWT